MAEILKWLGFAETRVIFWVDHKTNQRRQRGRLEIIASRKEGLLQEFNLLEPKSQSETETHSPQQQRDDQLQRHNEQLEQHNSQLQQQRDNLQRQLDTVTSSRTWKLITAQRKLRSWTGQTLDSIKRRS